MSDINPNRMIPLHVCDQAVAACEKEIAALKAEVERLKAVSTIDQRTIQGLQQTPEWSEIARLTADYRALEAENARLQGLAMIREGRLAVPYDYEQLREENARLKAELTDRKAEADRLKAEVERLRKAGDAMAKRTEFFQKRWDADELCQEVVAWNAAKEGKPSV